MRGLAVIAFKDVVFAYGNRAEDEAVLDGVSFEVARGDFVAIMGNNGSGKSTLAKLCDGFLFPESGTVEVLGHDTTALDRDGLIELRQRAGLVFQNPDDQFVTSQVLDEVSFGPCNLGLDRVDLVERVGAALDAVGMLSFLDRNVSELSGGEKQRIAIANALAMRPEILLLDEPTSMLDPEGRKDVMSIITELHARGMTIVLITHDPDEAMLADSVLLIEDGRCRPICPADLEEEREYSKDACSPATKMSANGLEGESNDDGRTIIELDEVAFSYDPATDLTSGLLGAPSAPVQVFDGLSLTIREGEAVAIMGPNGCGKSTVLQLMNGLLKPSTGTVMIDGIPTSDKRGANHARSTVGLCFQFPERSIFSQTVYDEVAFGPRNLGLSDEEVDERVRQAMDAMDLDHDAFAKRSPFSLSGGEQRRVALAAVLSMKPKVLALDEPCSGLDRPTHDALMDTLLAIKASATTIVLVTHDERDAASLADRIISL